VGTEERGEGMNGVGFDRLSPPELTLLRISLPTDDEVRVGWALPLLDLPASQKTLAVQMQIEVLTGLWADPRAWCVRAFELAERERRVTH